MSREHHDWAPAFDGDSGCWRVARLVDAGSKTYGASPTGDGTPYRFCCEASAAQMAAAMNSVGHP